MQSDMAGMADKLSLKKQRGGEVRDRESNTFKTKNQFDRETDG